MKILFAFSDYLLDWYGCCSSVLYDFIEELKSRADVRCVFFNYKRQKRQFPAGIVDAVFTPENVFEAFSTDARILEGAGSVRAQLGEMIAGFKPDVIHCNDRQSFLPFRFDKNVLYDSRMIFSDSITDSVITDMDFLETKTERCALSKSAVLCVHSDSDARAAERLSGGLCVPIVLPSGVRRKTDRAVYRRNEGGCLYVAQNAFYGKDETAQAAEQSGGRGRKKLRVCCFCRKIRAMRNGAAEFITAINRLGADFKEQYCIEYYLYTVSPSSEEKTLSPADVPLIDGFGSAFSEEICRAADIVVISKDVIPFSAALLMAMSAGCLVLLPNDTEAALFVSDRWNCLLFSDDASGCEHALKNAVQNFALYRFIRANAIRTSLHWSTARSVRSHLFVYEQMVRGRISLLDSAYRREERKLLDIFRISDDSKKATCAQKEIQRCTAVISRLLRSGTYTKILVLTGAALPGPAQFPKSVEVFSVLNESRLGFVVRPECLPFDDGEFDVVVSAGCWETVIEPCGALIELQRVCRKKIVILYNCSCPYPWQTVRMETAADWQKLTGTDWNVVCDAPENDFPDDEYQTVVYTKKAYDTVLVEAGCQSGQTHYKAYKKNEAV